MLHVVDWIVAGVVGWGVTYFYYRRSKADTDALRSAVEKAVAEGIVSAMRNASGQITGLKRPSAPTELRIS